MIAPPKFLHRQPESTPKKGGSVRSVPARHRDTYKRTAGRSWSVLSASRKKIAAALRVDPTNVSRRKSGRASTYLSRLSEEAALLEADGFCTAFMIVHLKANALMPQLRKQTRAEIEAELTRLYLEEQSANGCFDQVQMKDLSDGRIASPEFREELGRCARIQAAKTERIVALLDRLDEMDTARGAR